MNHLAKISLHKAQKEPAFSLMEIADNKLPFLQGILRHNPKADPFARSVGYYAMTGRKGLWLYGDENTGMVIARHPNRPDTMLFFPPFGTNQIQLIFSALEEPEFAGKKIQLARVGQDDQELVRALKFFGVEPPKAETILDWVFPIHVISTEDVITHQGGGYNNFRAHLNKAFRAGYTADVLCEGKHSDAIISIVSRWAEDGKKEGFTFEDLTTPTKQLLRLMKDKNLSIGGVIVFDGQKPIGFWIWDGADTHNKTAMSLARVSIGNRGAAEFAGLKMAEILKACGFDHICLGGSETKSLDTFKRKFKPMQSILLRTMDLLG